MIKPDDSSQWVLKPRIGLGDMLFGMNRDSVDALSAYGASTGSVGSNRMSDDDAADFFKSLGFEDSEITNALNKQAEFARPDTVTETRSSGLVLEYDKGELIQILADTKAKKLNYGTRFIFREPPMDIVRHLAASLGEQPIIFENEVVFADNLIFLYEFVKTTKDNSSYAEGDRGDRSAIWRSKYRHGGEDLSKYKPMIL